MIKLTLGIRLYYDKDKKFYDSFAKGFKSSSPKFYFLPQPGLNLHVTALNFGDTIHRFFFLIKDVIYEKENKDRPKD